MRFTISVLCCFAALCCFETAVVAQDAPKLAKEPIVVMRSGGISKDAASAYVRQLNEQLEIGGAIAKASTDASNAELVTSHSMPTNGMLVYMASGLIPSAEQIVFSEVVDHAEFVRLINTRSSKFGTTSTLEGSGDLYQQVVTLTWRVQVQEVSQTDGTSPDLADSTADAEVAEGSAKESKQVSLSIGIGSSPGVVVQALSSEEEGELIEENGVKFREHSSTNRVYFRYHDGFMFESQSADLFEMSLPSGDSLRQREHGEVNGEVTFYPDCIPMGFRHLGWNALNTAAGAELQQRDDEDSLSYAARRSFGDAGLALVRSAIFDTERVSAWFRFSEDQNPVRSEFRIAARRNSDLGKTLKDIASAERRFAPVLNDNAAATFYGAIHLPDLWKNAIEAGLAIGLEDVAAESQDAAQYAEAARCVLSSFASITEHGNVEFLTKIGWSEKSGGVIYGGLQIDDNEQLLNAILTLLNDGATSDEEYKIVRLPEYEMLKIRIPSDLDMEPVRLSHLYLANINSCFWFAAGGENAHEIIAQSVERCNASSGRQSTPILTMVVDLEQWASYSPDDATGLTRLHSTLIPAVMMLACEILGDVLPFDSAEDEPGTYAESQALFTRALALGGSQRFTFAVDADESGMVAGSQLGDALARGFAALMLQKADELFKNSQPDSLAEDASAVQ